MAGTAERILTERELNRALLSRQLLLERARTPVARALERVAGIQSQYAPSSYVGLWSRLEGLERADLTRALERRAVVQGTLLRATIHLVSARDWWPFAEAIRRDRRGWWLRGTRRPDQVRVVEAAARRTRELLADGPSTRSEILEDLGVGASAWNGVQLWLDLVRVPPSGTWEQRRADRYALADAWLRAPATPPSESDAVAHLVRRYLAGFGPASRKDVLSFTGLSPATLDTVLEELRLRRFRDEQGVELLDVARAPLPDAATRAPPRFLPTWDATLLVHARRTQILPERYRPLVFDTKTPHSVSTFTVDGQVAGTWREERGRVRLEPFEPLPRSVRRDVEEEARALAGYLA